MPTLIELLVSIAITSILLTMGLSSWQHFKLFQQTAYITHALQQSFYFAREQAVLRHQNILIIPNNGNWQNGWTLQSELSKKVLSQQKKLPFAIHYIAFQKSNSMIKVFADSTTMGYQGHFEYGDQKLFLNQGGRLRLD